MKHLIVVLWTCLQLSFYWQVSVAQSTCSLDNLGVCDEREAAAQLNLEENSESDGYSNEAENESDEEEEEENLPELLPDIGNEDTRISEHQARNYTWPPKIIPDTPGWNKLMMRRFHQLQFVEEIDERWLGHVLHTTSAIVAPNFTANGWGLTRAPQALVDELRQAVKEGLANDPPLEASGGDVIEGPNQPLLVDPKGLDDKVLKELWRFHEAWAGIPLIGQNSYGFRVYRNETDLKMHVDIPKSHIISCILHIDHDDDPESEPWPIVIEDFQGNTNEVVMESGDMLFYESSKCMHGRPKKFKGKWYSSIFVHYYPANDWDGATREREAKIAVPSHWRDGPPEEMDVELLQIISGNSLKEPSCKNNWCALENSVKWYGPAKFGEVLTTGGVTFPLHVELAEHLAES